MDMVFLNRFIMPVRWVDLDAYNHVNNARYFDAMSEARTSLLADFLGKDFPWQFVLVDTDCNFKRSFKFPSTMLIDQYLTEIKKSSFSLYYQFFSQGDEQTVYAEGHAKLVCVNVKTSSVVRMPEEVLNKLKSMG